MQIRCSDDSCELRLWGSPKGELSNWFHIICNAETDRYFERPETELRFAGLTIFHSFSVFSSDFVSGGNLCKYTRLLPGNEVQGTYEFFHSMELVRNSWRGRDTAQDGVRFSTPPFRVRSTAGTIGTMILHCIIFSQLSLNLLHVEEALYTRFI